MASSAYCYRFVTMGKIYRKNTLEETPVASAFDELAPTLWG